MNHFNSWQAAIKAEYPNAEFRKNVREGVLNVFAGGDCVGHYAFSQGLKSAVACHKTLATGERVYSTEAAAGGSK